MTREEKIASIFSSLEIDVNLILLVRTVFKNTIMTVDDASLDRIYLLFNPPTDP